MTQEEFEIIKEECLKNNIDISGDENNFYFELLSDLGCLFKGLVERKEE